MSVDVKAQAEPIRLVFELARADHPRLYDDLIQFQKGTKRINRLRLLAYDGLLVQNGHIVPGRDPSQSGDVQGGDGEPGPTVITNDLFGPSITE